LELEWREGGGALEKTYHCHLMAGDYGEGGGDVREVEKAALSTKAAQVESNDHLPPHQSDEGVEVAEEDVSMNTLTLVDLRSKGEKIVLVDS
jgi:hypothetical protein